LTAIAPVKSARVERTLPLAV